MNTHDTLLFAKCLHLTATVYNKSLSSELIELYWQVLSTHSIETIKYALQQHIRCPQRGRFFPTPADIEYALQTDHTQRAQTAWQCLTKAIHHAGLYSSITFEDHIIASVVRDLGGWRKLCASQEHQLSHYAHEFQHKYITYLQQPKSLAQPTPKTITGLIDNHNGTSNQPTTLITMTIGHTTAPHSHKLEGEIA